MIVIGTLGTSGLTLSVVFRNAAMQAWNTVTSSWVSLTLESIADCSIAVTADLMGGVYRATVPTLAAPDFATAFFYQSSDATYTALAVASVLVDESLSPKSMLSLASGRLAGASPTRNQSTGVETFNNADGVPIMTAQNQVASGIETEVRTVL